MNFTTETGAVCTKCNRVRKKAHRPWPLCDRCGVVLCLTCLPVGYVPSRKDSPYCSLCYDVVKREKEELRLRTPFPCRICLFPQLPSSFKNPNDPKRSACLECHRKAETDSDLARRVNAKLSLVEVQYGEHDPSVDGGHGYAYSKGDLEVGLGDIVWVPANWLSRLKGSSPELQLATIVSTYSVYPRGVYTIHSIERKAT